MHVRLSDFSHLYHIFVPVFRQLAGRRYCIFRVCGLAIDLASIESSVSGIGRVSRVAYWALASHQQDHRYVHWPLQLHTLAKIKIIKHVLCWEREKASDGGGLGADEIFAGTTRKSEISRVCVSSLWHKHSLANCDRTCTCIPPSSFPVPTRYQFTFFAGADHPSLNKSHSDCHHVSPPPFCQVLHQISLFFINPALFFSSFSTTATSTSSSICSSILLYF